MSRVYRLPLWIVALAIPAMAGCARDEVHVYDVPYEKQRMLGAIVMADRSNTWFFKLMGRADDTAANRDYFMKFVKSLRFPVEGKEPVAWDLPDEWSAELAGQTGMGIRYATIYIPRGQVVSVTRLSEEGGGLLPNLNRWRDQMKLPPITNYGELDNQCERVPLGDGHVARVVDMESSRGLALVEEPPPPKRSAKPLDFDLPEGWKEQSAAGKMWAAGFRVDADGQSAEITVTPLGGPAGGIAGNVNRWRGQVGLPESSEEQIMKESQTIEVARVSSTYVDLAGPKGLRMLAVISQRGEQTWFVKMLGPTDLVAKQKPAFESFVKSLRFGGGL
jgi:hypothetical protein